jgi:hypothetical protein
MQANYLEWNDKLAAHFFNADMAGRPVYLYANNDLLFEIGGSTAGAVEDFVSAVKQGPPWVTHGELCQRALQAMKDWRDKNRLYPPYIGYLCLFVLAAGEEGDFAAHAYYPRLRKILGYADQGMLPSFNRMLELWDDLETWSNKDTKGATGIFTARIAGNWIHVGLPIAQTILTEYERRVLPRIFFLAGLDPTSTPPAAALARALKTYGHGDFRRRTLQILNEQSERDIFEALLEIIADELSEWDGHVEDEAFQSGGEVRSFAVVRLCLAFDSVACHAKCVLRLKINRDFPEMGLLLSTPASDALISCEEFVDRWSTPLAAVEGRPLDAATIDWREGTAFRDDRLDWQFKLPGGPVRILVKGEAEGLPGLVETQSLPRLQPFYLLYDNSESGELSSWLRDDCQGVRQFGGVEGLPRGWHLAYVNEAVRDSVRQQIPLLSFPNVRRIRFSGGLRSSAGSTFFGFAPPAAAIVDGKDGTEQAFCNGHALSQVSGDTYSLPDILPTDERVLVEVRSGESLVRRSFYLSGDFPWDLPEPLRQFSKWGEAITQGTDTKVSFGGVIFFGQPVDVSGFRKAIEFCRHSEGIRTSRIFYIGRHVGEIASWPSEPLPRDWVPIWAVSLARRGRSVYCGEDPTESLPEEGHRASRERCNLWIRVLWHERKRIAPPRHPLLTKLWQKYIEAARDA